MKSFFLIILICTFTFLSSLAQQWSPEQKEVIQHIQTCFDTWADKNYDRWFAVCHPDTSAVLWNTTQGSPNKLDTWRKDLEVLSKTTYKFLYSEIRPLSVLIDRDVAIIHYYSVSNRMDGDKRITIEQKRMEILRKSGGKWSLIGGMYSPVIP